MSFLTPSIIRPYAVGGLRLGAPSLLTRPRSAPLCPTTCSRVWVGTAPREDVRLRQITQGAHDLAAVIADGSFYHPIKNPLPELEDDDDGVPESPFHKELRRQIREYLQRKGQKLESPEPSDPLKDPFFDSFWDDPLLPPLGGIPIHPARAKVRNMKNRKHEVWELERQIRKRKILRDDACDRKYEAQKKSKHSEVAREQGIIDGLDREIGDFEKHIDRIDRVDGSDHLEIERFLDGEIERLRNDKFDIDHGWFWEPHVVPPSKQKKYDTIVADLKKRKDQLERLKAGKLRWSEVADDLIAREPLDLPDWLFKPIISTPPMTAPEPRDASLDPLMRPRLPRLPRPGGGFPALPALPALPSEQVNEGSE